MDYQTRQEHPMQQEPKRPISDRREDRLQLHEERQVRLACLQAALPGREGYDPAELIQAARTLEDYVRGK